MYSGDNQVPSLPLLWDAPNMGCLNYEMPQIWDASTMRCLNDEMPQLRDAPTMGWPYPDYRMPRLGMHTVTARHVMDVYARHVMDAVAFPFPREKCQTLHDQLVMN